MKNTRAILAVMITCIAGLGIFIRPEHIDKFIGMLTTVWGTYVAGKMNWNKPAPLNPDGEGGGLL